ncbi:MAG: maleylacetoacetate isomerase [Gammaproteobacteria bacterium]|nr:maleylacetoacetate isomerase [Gammaproteobacteria bacterium]
MERILYDYFRSSAAYRVRIALNLKGVDVTRIAVNILPGIDEQHSERYRQLNPQGRVPYYTEDDFRLGQSPAILEYLEEQYPSPALLPEGAREKAYVRQLSAIIACDIHPLNNLCVLEYLRNELAADNKTIDKWYAHWIQEGFRAFEKMLTTSNGSGLFCFGDKPTFADICLVPQIFNARRFEVPLDTFPTIVKIGAECAKLPAFQAASPTGLKK